LLEKDFKNMVVVNYGYLNSNDPFEEHYDASNNQLSKDQWFNYVVSDDVIDTIKEELESKAPDNSRLKSIIYDDVLNSRNVVYHSNSENNALEQAKKLSENTLVLRLQ
jgi:replicative superfamily II helicase